MASDPIFEIFREEAREHLAALERLFLDLEGAETEEARRDLINNLFRHAHSLKGDAKVVGLVELKEASQRLEDILDELRTAPQQVDRTAIDQGLAQFDRLREILEAWQSRELDGAEPDASGGPESEQPESEQPKSEPEPREPGAAAQPKPAPKPPPRDTGSGAARRKSSRAATKTRRKPPTDSARSASDVSSREGKASDSEHPPAVAAMAEERFTVRVPSERLDRMLNLAGEVRIAQSASDAIEMRLAELTQQLATVPHVNHHCDAAGREAWQSALTNWQASLLDQCRRLEGDVHKQGAREQRLMEALEANIRQARLLPVMMLTDMIRRAVRDLSKTLDKPIRYEADVGEIMLDKAVIEALKDPLVHLVRNAADHGIESVDQRRAAGKPETAVIRIEAWRRNELVRLRIVDDGRGVDYERIRQRLIRSGSLDTAEVRQLSERELADFLFQPGFTTAPAGETSGRGVGLDVVRRTVEKLRGTAELESSSAAGAAFGITVPVTISTVRILTVLAGGQYYGIPSDSLLRIGRARPSDLRELQGAVVLAVDGQPVRLVPLADLLSTAAAHSVAPETCIYVLVRGPEGLLAVTVDELEDESEVLLKPLSFPLAGLPGMIGATIRVDGSVQLVVDLSSPAFARPPTAAKGTPAARPAARRILVVDDSPTTRAVLRNVLTAAGYQVRTATDGIDALERLRTQAVDLIVCDIEMPRLNGLDLTRQVKSKYALPVILVTGKEKEQQRREGLEAGADAYVVKSTFVGEGLLDVIKQLT